MDKNVAYIENIIFIGKQNIAWNQVEQYLKSYIGKSYIVEETKDVISVASDFPNEYAESIIQRNKGKKNFRDHIFIFKQ